MKINIRDDSLSFVKELINDVVNAYENSLNEKFIFCAKLHYLEVNIWSTVEGADTFGICTQESQQKYILNLMVNAENTRGWNAFIIAHELAHLLIFSVEGLKIAGEAKDGSTNFTAVARLSSDGSTYGDALEECIADYLALYIVRKLNLEDSQVRVYEEKNELEFFIVEELSSNFGDTINNSEFIDSYTCDEEKDEINISNLFWSSIVTFTFEKIVNEYDKYMGNNSFKALNEDLEEFYDNRESNKFNCDCILNELRRFKKRYQQQ